jgi:tetratricopeptide (TPR) repeat protein
MRRWCGASLVSVVLLTSVVPAGHAQSAADAEKAQKAASLDKMKQGRKQFDLGKFDEAIRLFEEAYDVYPYPEALYNLGQAWRQKGDVKKAVFYYKSYLRNKPTAANRADVEARIKELEGAVERPPIEVQDPEQPDAAPAASPPDAGVEAVDVAPPPPLPPVVRGEASERWHDDTWGWILGGAGIAVMGGGVGFFLAASSAEADAEGEDELTREGLLADADDYRLAGGVALGVGGALLTAGVVKLWLTDGAGEDAGRLGFVGGANWIGVAGRF